LKFEDEAFCAVAKLALERQIGARGLRSIMEDVMMRLMYEMPSRTDVAEIVITADYVNGKGEPQIILK
jgi:ATP-dependent Clp protease ATP-binding subunit ClpX